MSEIEEVKVTNRFVETVPKVLAQNCYSNDVESDFQDREFEADDEVAQFCSVPESAPDPI